MRILISNFAILDKAGFSRTPKLAQELVRLGNQVTLLTSLPSNKFVFPYKKIIRDGVTIIAFPDIVPNSFRRTGFSLFTFFFKLVFILFNKYDIYHSDVGHRPSGGIPILIKKLFSRVVYITEWYNYYGRGGQFDTKRGFKKITHGFYDLFWEVRDKKLADGVVCLSTEMASRAISENISKSKVTVINGGADVRSIPFSISPKFREKYGISQDSLTFGFAGMSVGQLEDIMPFIGALNKLSYQNSKIANSTLITTGNFLPESIQKSLGNRFKFLEYGWVDYKEYGELLNCADYFILLQEPNLDHKTRWPNRLGDYIAAGRKTIINPFGETKILVRKYEKLFITTAFDEESLREQLIKLANQNDHYLDRERIRKIAEQKVSWNHRAIELNEFYNRIINAKRKQ